MLTQKELKSLLHYSPETGLFTWKVYRSHNAMKGDRAGGVDVLGYIQISIKEKNKPKKRYRGHRLAWLYVYGEWPKNEIDHINHDRSDNKMVNLRHVTHKQNLRNISISTANLSGVVGVGKRNSYNKWYSSIKVNGKYFHLGHFDDKFEAICARLSANNKYGFHKNHGD